MTRSQLTKSTGHDGEIRSNKLAQSFETVR
jgi:hypothetical protein